MLGSQQLCSNVRARSVCTHGWRTRATTRPRQTSANGLRAGSSGMLRSPVFGHPLRGAEARSAGKLRRPDTAARASSIQPLGFDLLTFLGSTVVVVPLFKRLKISPVLGFLFSGVVLHQLGLIRDPKDMEALSELGVLFLLFEMGLELSLDRLKALAKYAFGLGTLQMVLCTGLFTAFALPAGSGLGTHLLEWLAHAPHSLVSIRSVDEAVVIGGALSMSSSAFVLQLLSERGELPTKIGNATLGILLFQDIAVVPFLVLLPLAVQLQSGGGINVADVEPASLISMLGPTALKTCAGLGLLLVGGRLLLRRVFEVVAQSDNSETFVGLCLLTVAGAALLTKSLGFSDTLGAFIAGVLLSESNYKAQVEADIRPFRGLLLGLFFVTTGGSIDMMVLRQNWEVIGWILAGLVVFKTGVVAALGPQFGLSRSESIRTGFLLSQGGEFAFVLLSLANQLKILPENLNQVLIIVVVLSMALTPGLAELGKIVGETLDDWLEKPQPVGALSASQAATMGVASTKDKAGHEHAELEEAVVICGFGPQGQMLAALLDSPMASLPEAASRAYIAFDLDPARVQAARTAGYRVVYGDGSRAAVLKAAGVARPRMVAVCLSNKVNAHKAVATLRSSFPTVPLYALGSDIRDAAELEEAGADRCVVASTAAGLALGSELLTRLGASVTEVSRVEKTIEDAMAIRTKGLAESLARYGSEALDRAGQDVYLLQRPRGDAATAEEEDAGSLVTAVTGVTGEGLEVVEVVGDRVPKREGDQVVEEMPSMADALPAGMASQQAAASQLEASQPPQLSQQDADSLEATVAALAAANNAARNGSGSGASSGSSSAGKGLWGGNGAANGAAAAATSNGAATSGAEDVADVAGGSSSSDEAFVKVGSARIRSPAPARNGSPTPARGSGARTSKSTMMGMATASMDCGGDDEECVVEEVAELVMVDSVAQKVQDSRVRSSQGGKAGSGSAADADSELGSGPEGGEVLGVESAESAEARALVTTTTASTDGWK